MQDAWPEPDLSLLDSRRGDLPSFPADVLPGFWRAWIEEAARAAGASVDHVALSLMTAAASLIGVARYVAPVPSWAEPCILWTVLVGSASSGKTPAAQTALRLMAMLEQQLESINAATRKRRATDAKAMINRWMKPESSVESLPPPFVPRRLTISDAAIRAVVDVMTGTPRGALLARDQHGPWLVDMVRSAATRRDRPFWLAAWSATAFRADRSHQWLDDEFVHPAVSILGTIRPEALSSSLDGDDDTDSLVARFLFTWPQSPPFHALTDMVLPDGTAVLEALSRLRDMPEERRDLPLAPGALAAFDGFRRMHHAEAGEREGREAGWWGKGAGLVLRLAGVLTFLDWAGRPSGTAEPDSVPAWAVEAASILWQGYLWPHAQAAFRTAGGDARESKAQRALRWLRRQGTAEISRTTLRRKALGLSCSAAETQRIAEALVTGGWLRPVEIASSSSGGRPPLRWAVNPELHRPDVHVLSS